MGEEKRCIATIYGERVTSWQCSRPAGYGPGGKYCKVHGRKKENVEATLPLWVVSRYSDELPKRVLAREIGDKTFIDEKGRRCKFHTEYDDYFSAEMEALEFAMDRAARRLESAKLTVGKMTETINLLKEAICKIKP